MVSYESSFFMAILDQFGQSQVYWLCGQMLQGEHNISLINAMFYLNLVLRTCFSGIYLIFFYLSMLAGMAR